MIAFVSVHKLIFQREVSIWLFFGKVNERRNLSLYKTYINFEVGSVVVVVVFCLLKLFCSIDHNFIIPFFSHSQCCKVTFSAKLTIKDHNWSVYFFYSTSCSCFAFPAFGLAFQFLPSLSFLFDLISFLASFTLSFLITKWKQEGFDSLLRCLAAFLLLRSWWSPCLNTVRAKEMTLL